MRSMVTETERDLDNLNFSFYQCSETDEDKYEKYLKQCDNWLLQANNHLRRKEVTLEVIDGEVKIVEMLNQLRETEADGDTIVAITELWENLKVACEALQTTVSKFQTNVLNRLKMYCMSYTSSSIRLDVTCRYTEEVSGYLADLETIILNSHTLLKSFPGGLHQDLFTNTRFSERILVCCDQKAFPILRFIPDLTEKVLSMCAVARKWLDRDETYVYEINNYIRETRTMTRKRAEVLKTEKEKQKKVVKTVKAASILCQNNKQKLQKIESELNELEHQITSVMSEKKDKCVEKQQKESMVDFLKISISQTKRNYTLQLKRSRLMRQVKELEQMLELIENELSTMQDQVVVKVQEKEVQKEKVETSKRSCLTLRNELEQFTKNLDQLEAEVIDLSGQLLQLEIIHTIKTSPEKVEEIYERPTSVKLAPSLKEKIKRRRKMAHNAGRLK